MVDQFSVNYYYEALSNRNVNLSVNNGQFEVIGNEGGTGGYKNLYFI